MIDWSARAHSILQKNPRNPTDKTDERGVTSVSSVPIEGASGKPQEGYVGFVSTCPEEPDGNAQLPGLIEKRLVRLLAIGAIDDDDAELVRRRWHVYPIEWKFLLDCCERAVAAN